MKTLVVPDVHERVWALKALENEINEAKRVVMLGDFFDTFHPEKHVLEMCAFVKAAIRDERFTVLIGNHDCHYYFPNMAFACSGFSHVTKLIVQDNITPDEIRKMRIWTKVGPYTVSHAGFCEATLPLKQETLHKEAIEQGLSGKRVHELFQAGRARGGPAPVGGPVWLDWNNEFEHVAKLPQIVGHTQGRDVRKAGSDEEFDSYCLDTASSHAAWVNEETGKITLIPVKV